MPKTRKYRPGKTLPHNPSSGMWCPHCHKTFKYREMWFGLGQRGLTVWDISEMLGVTWQTVRTMAKKYKMSLAIRGTSERNSLEEIALRSGFDSARDMIYNFFIVKKLSFGRAGRYINVHPEILKDAVEQIIIGGNDEEAQKKLRVMRMSAKKKSK